MNANFRNIFAGFINKTVFYSVFIAGIHSATLSQAFDTKALNAILVDAKTDAVLFEKNSDQLMHPSSMSKLMTIYMVFDRLKQGKLSLKDTFTVSEKAWRMQGSKMFVHVGSQVSIEELIRGVIIQSGNDACVTLAEGLMGSEEAFAEAMNKKAKELGLKHSHFKNATGWPDPEHLMTSRDLAILAEHLITQFPEYYHYFSEMEFVYNNIRQQNRNMLLGRNLGVDGLKTGHTEEAGYGITISAEQKGRRLILVVNGLEGTVERANEAERLLQYGFLNFENHAFFNKGEIIEHAPVWMGQEKTVPLVINEEILFTTPKQEGDKIKLILTYQSPLKAPLKEGMEVGKLTVSSPSLGEKHYRLMTGKSVEKLSYFSRVIANARYYLFGIEKELLPSEIKTGAK